MGIVNSYGSQVAAAYGIAAQLWTYIQMPALAIGAAVSSMAAQNVGAGRWDRIGRIAASGVGFNLVLTGALVAVLWLFDRSVLSLFLSSDSAAIDIAAHINNVASWSFILFGVTIVLFATVRATGAVMPPLIILVISVLVVRTGFAYFMRDVIGEEALWWSFPGRLDHLACTGRRLLSLRPLAHHAHDRGQAGRRRTAGHRARRAAPTRAI